MLRKFYYDPEYYKNLFRLAAPILVQYVISNLLNIIDIAMIGKLGEAAIAAVGVCNQLFFVMVLFFFGINSGAGIFAAQYFGKGDHDAIRRVTVLGLGLSLLIGLVFTLISQLFPSQLVGIYTADPEVIRIGARYLRIVGLGYIPTSITMAFVTSLRATRQVRLPMIVSTIALALKTALSYALIFGLFGMPELGTDGAAIGTVVARLVECGVLVGFIYGTKNIIAFKRIKLDSYTPEFMSRFLRTILPVAINEMVWSLAVMANNIVYGHIGTAAFAAINVVTSIESLVFVLFMAFGEATGIMIGNKIGEKDKNGAFTYGVRSLSIGFTGALMIGVIIFSLATRIASFYHLEAETINYLVRLIQVFSLILWLRVSNFFIIIGILRAGGDTKMCLILDTLPIWLIGVPTAVITGLILKLPIYEVYLLVHIEELIKLFFGLRRVLSKKWIHDLVHHEEPLPPEAAVI